MKLYRLLNALPGARIEFNRKLEAVVVLAALAPFVVYAGTRALLGDPPELGLLLLLFCLSQGGALLTYLLLRLLLEPLFLVERTLVTRQPGPALEAQMDSQDLLARLVRDAAALAQRHEQEARHIQAAALTDDLTGVYTRAAIKRRLVEDCARTDRKQMTLHVALIRVENLPAVAQAHGPAEADALLRLAAELMRGTIRKADWLGRWTSDSFILGFCDNEQLETALTRDITRLGESALTTAGGRSVALEIFCGAAQYLPGTGPRNVLTSAGKALEAARHLGPGNRRFVIARPTPAELIDPELADFLDT